MTLQFISEEKSLVLIKRQISLIPTMKHLQPRGLKVKSFIDKVAQLCLEDMLDWISYGGNDSPSGYTPQVTEAPEIARVPSTIGAGVAGPSSIALYDATNSTKDRR